MSDRWRCFVYPNVRRATCQFAGTVGDDVNAAIDGITWRSSSFAWRLTPLKDTGSDAHQEIVTVFVGDPVRSPTASGPGRAALCVTIFWRSSYRGSRLHLIVVPHQFRERDLIFAHLCDYFSEDDFGLTLSSDIQLVLKRFASREQFFKGGHFSLHYKSRSLKLYECSINVLLDKGRRWVIAF
ncbi:MAG: hypothetical protein JWQ50_658 [Caballeronia mineralivorans]|jgi:hypothetical protein|nr:hypothetical protein [Caballeronia mineralivorans]MEA3095998.1 hypothetical protein [Caballeronia mineralivorans]